MYVINKKVNSQEVLIKKWVRKNENIEFYKKNSWKSPSIFYEKNIRKIRKTIDKILEYI